MSTYAERLTNAAQALGLTPEGFTGLFNAKIGLDTVEDLDNAEVFKFGDFLKKFEDYPIGKVRKAFAALKDGKTQEAPTTDTASNPRLQELRTLGLRVRVEDADPATLLPYYLPDKPADPVTAALKKRFGDKPVLAFREDGKVALNETLQYIADLEQNYPERDAIMVDNKLVKLWPIGTKPNTMVDEDPLFPGRPLRNGYSTVNHRNWTNINFVNRQFCRIIVDRGDIDPDNHEAVLRLLERAAADKLGEAYPEADLKWRELKAKDDLPKLKVELGTSASKPNNPFGVSRKY